MNSNENIFIYKDSLGHFNTATSPRFIAMHKCCVAIPREIIVKKYDLITDFIYELNQYKVPKKARDLAISTDLTEIL